jgi:hypothetical protein
MALQARQQDRAEVSLRAKAPSAIRAASSELVTGGFDAGLWLKIRNAFASLDEKGVGPRAKALQRASGTLESRLEVDV